MSAESRWIPGDDPTDTRELGDTLRGEREARCLSIEDVQRETRVRSRYLQSLETGRLDELPGGAYTWGYLRAYADFLGLDGAAMVHHYRDEAAAARLAAEQEAAAQRASERPALFRFLWPRPSAAPGNASPAPARRTASARPAAGDGWPAGRSTAAAAASFQRLAPSPLGTRRGRHAAGYRRPRGRPQVIGYRSRRRRRRASRLPLLALLAAAAAAVLVFVNRHPLPAPPPAGHLVGAAAPTAAAPPHSPAASPTATHGPGSGPAPAAGSSTAADPAPGSIAALGPSSRASVHSSATASSRPAPHRSSTGTAAHQHHGSLVHTATAASPYGGGAVPGGTASRQPTASAPRGAAAAAIGSAAGPDRLPT